MSRKQKKTIFVAMSGGVDSSVAAALLKQRGFNVVGAFMRCVNLDGCAEQDAEDARRVAEHLGIPFYVFDFENEYRREVVDYMIEGYRKGVTPNPDVMCNKEIKFGLFLTKARALGADAIATGHYARLGVSVERLAVSEKKTKTLPPKADPPLVETPKRYTLFVAKDKNKDQSYFLWTLTPEVLSRCLFPIGDYTKPEVRRMARRFGLPTAEKKDSQGICFLGKVSLCEFLKTRIPERLGAVVTTDGKKIGEHRGAWFYTIGQRHIGVANRGIARTERGTTRTKDADPLYVAAKDVKTNTLVVAEGNDNPALYRTKVTLADVSFIRSLPSLIRGNKGIMENKIHVLARVRYRQPLAPATLVIKRHEIRSKGSRYSLIFDRPQKFVASGQSAVLYSARGEVLGGGVIAQRGQFE
ncbi:MAG: tRNA 2-thiouridine(34) synthase MnmA [bacterium]|nr:tRNA 2-thiouridine(34) synthase MnmA [bacterium]